MASKYDLGFTPFATPLWAVSNHNPSDREQVLGFRRRGAGWFYVTVANEEISALAFTVAALGVIK